MGGIFVICICLFIMVTNVFLPAFIRLYDTAVRLGQLQSQFKLAIDPVEYARENLKFGLVEVVYEWAKVFSVYPKRKSL